MIDEDAAVVVENVDVELKVAGELVVSAPDIYRLVVVAFPKLALFAVSPVDEAVTAPEATFRKFAFEVVAFEVDAYCVVAYEVVMFAVPIFDVVAFVVVDQSVVM